MAKPSEVYSKITEVNKADKRYPRAVLRAFIKTDRAFAEAMRGKVDLKSHGITEGDEEGMDVTVIDLPTYRHLPQEFLSFSDTEKRDLIRALCLQNEGIPSGKGEKGDEARDTYIANIARETMDILRDHLHVSMPNKFDHRHVTSIKGLMDFMDMGGFHSDNEKLYHCMFLKSMFLVHVIHATVDIEKLPKISKDIRTRIANHPRITVNRWDEESGQMSISYSVPGIKKPQTATITFGEKCLESIFDKLARKSEYGSPDILNDLVRMNTAFNGEEKNNEARLWLLTELDKIAFGTVRVIEIQISTKEGHTPIISQKLFKNKTKVRNIPDIHNIQVTGPINPDLPVVRGVKNFEVMCTESHVDFNENGKGNRKVYKVERLQQAFSRLKTGAYGILKPGQVKYALQDYARELGVTETPDELLELLLSDKQFLIPVSVIHGQSLCYRVKGILRPEAGNLGTFEIQDLDPKDTDILHRLMREFRKAKTSSLGVPKD